jgi:hypothetical protein
MEEDAEGGKLEKKKGGRTRFTHAAEFERERFEMDWRGRCIHTQIQGQR